MTGGWSRDTGQVREQLSAIRSVLVLFMLLTQQNDQRGILHLVANSVESLGPFRLEGICLDGEWQDIRVPGRETGPSRLPRLITDELNGWPMGGGRFTLAGVPWSWAYSLSSSDGLAGYLLVGAEARPAEGERFLLRMLAQQAGVALANARLHRREREQAAELQVTNLALQRSMKIHDRLTRVALEGTGQEGIAQAVYELTDRAVAIEDRFGNLRAWAGPGRPAPYPKDDPDERDRLLGQVMAAASPVREKERLISVARLGGAPLGVLVLHDPDETAGDPERMAIEHATTVLAMEFARLQSLVETDMRLRINLVLDLVGGRSVEGGGVLNRAQALGYDIGRPHWVVVVDGGRSHDEIDVSFNAVTRAARAVRVGSLVASRLHDVILLAGTEGPWERFRDALVTELRGRRCRVGVGGRCTDVREFPRSYHEAQLALRIQKTIGGPEQVTVFSDLGVYKVLATADDTSAMERFVGDWLGRLIEYDAIRGAQLVLTLSEYLDRGGNYDASANALSVHRSTLKYRLRRIREVSGYDLGLPDIQFNLQLATRAWRTLQALRDS